MKRDTVLIIYEDDDSGLQQIREACDLVDSKMSICSFKNGGHLIQFLQHHKNTPSVVVIFDNLLSAIARELIIQVQDTKTTNKKVPVVVVCGVESQAIKEHALELGACGFYSRPTCATQRMKLLEQISFTYNGST